MFMKEIFILCAALGLIGCASATPQSENLLKNPPATLPRRTEIPGVPFLRQADNYCGPATLTMVLQWSGEKNLSVDDVAQQVFTPGMKGTFQTDMISAGRRRGRMALPLHGMKDLLTEVAAGHPVIVFENLSVKWWPQWHYAVVFGYDLDAQKVLMHSGPEAEKRWDLKTFERSWKLGDYWGLVVLPPDQRAATADELAHMKAAAALEQIGKETEAKTAYQTVLSHWPKSFAARVGLGNLAYRQGRHREAAKYFREALKIDPSSDMVRHNLAVITGKAVTGKATSDGSKPYNAPPPADQKR
jgi:hypothetical protein